MSTFKVSLTKIEKLWDHPNADRLDLAKAEGLGYQFCCQKGSQVEGGEVVYFPIDSIIPDDLAEHLNIKNLLAGKKRDRIKTVKLRGEISQGLVISIDTIKAFLDQKGITWPPEDLTASLGVSKYDPPEISCKAGTLMPLPDGVPIYDIEGADNHPNILKLLLDQDVCITEKLEGTNFAIAAMIDGEIMVCQRTKMIVPIEEAEHEFWRAVRIHGYDKIIKRIQQEFYPGKRVTLRGELIGPGIQKNIYNIDVREAYFFDVLVNGEYLPPCKWKSLCEEVGLRMVPILFEGKLSDWLGERSLQEMSNGRSKLGVKHREGVVIKPFQECYDGTIGRLVLKQRSPEYLAKSNL